ncbi:hypothetical protein LIER_39622 [Lithospermum erythrorhizon]|uniref:Calmodulin-binding domain-containing protein n=1 Tax=Lithospermum erythrorhizon TaxID=34254 RepID=A0AAV3QHK9_LITER
MNQQGGSEIDEATSVESSSNGSSTLPNSNQTARIQKMLKTYGVSGSFRRRTKSRTIQRNLVSSKGTATPQYSLSVEGRDNSPNYLKATSSFEGKKTNAQASSRSSLSLYDNSEQCSSHISTPKSVSPKSSLARTPSMRSVRIQLNRTSLKPKRASFKSSQNSQDSNVDRATCSSIFKDKKFPEQLELGSNEMAAEQKSTMKACPYQHCSLHGHNKNAAPAPRQFTSKKQRSLKPQTNMKPETMFASVANISGDKKQELFKLTSNLESSSLDKGVHGAVLTPGKKEKDVSFSIEIHAKIKAQFSSKTDEETGHSAASELTLVESSCLLESQDSLKEMINALIKSLSDLKEKSVGCRCKSEVHEERSFQSAPESSEVGDIAESNIAHEEHEITTHDQNEVSYVVNSTDLPVSPDAQANQTKFDDVSEKHNSSTSFENSDIGLPEQSEISKVQDHYSTEPLDTSAGENTNNTLEAALTLDRDFEDNKSIQVEYPESSSNHDGNQATLGGGKNTSMWQLIHQRMISSLASDVETRLPQIENEKNQVEHANKSPAVRASTDTERQEDKDNQSDGTVNQDIELRKVLAIKLVREAIEKILLPEVPDQSSDDQSTTSEATSEQDLSEQIHAEENLKESKSETDDTKEPGSCVVSKDENQQVKTLKKLEDKSEKKGPKHWSNLKKWIILQRFVKALEKVKQFNPRGPRYLQLEPKPEGEKVALRPQTVEEKKNAEEWMLDYALRQAISQLAPTQKKKVSLLVKAFETVVPPHEDSDIHSTISKLKETDDKSTNREEKHENSLPEGNDTKQENVTSPLTDQERDLSTENEETKSMVAGSQILNYPGSDPSDRINTAPQELIQEGKSHQEIYKVGVPSVEASAASVDLLTSSSEATVQEGDHEVNDGESLLPQGPSPVESNSNDNEEEKKDHIKMWHMVYQHVVASIVEKVGAGLLDGTDDEDLEDATELPKFLTTDQYGELETYETVPRSGFSRSEAVKLVQDAVDEILLPEIQDDLSETQSVTSDTVTDQDLSDKSQLGKSTVDGTSIQVQKGEILKQNISNPPKMNWSKVKKLMLLKKSIRALEKARNPKSLIQNIMQSKADPQPDTVDLRRQMMDEKKKAEQWMLDYAVRNIVHTLTPARKRRVSMLVEAFEAVVPLPEI